MTGIKSAIAASWLRPSRLLLAIGCLCGGTWAVVTAWVAIGEAFQPGYLPELLEAIRARLPTIFPVHMATGGLALLLVPLTLVLRPWPRWHRVFGWLTALSVFIGGFSALIVAVHSGSPLLARIGFFVQGLAWIGFLSAGLVMIRRGRVRHHRRFMLMMAAVTSGAMVFRVLLAGFTSLWPAADYQPFYSLLTWLGWLLPLAAVVGWERLAMRRRAIGLKPSIASKRSGSTA